MAGCAGFDISGYPGDAVVAWLKAHTNLVWCGYYLGGAPSHPGVSWMGKRAALTEAGWGLAPLYVGEQVIPPGSQNPSAAKGTIDGKQAVDLMTSEGFAQGTRVFLDLEDGSLPPSLSAYTAAWVDAVNVGGFLGSVYCSHRIAQQVNNLRPGVSIWAFNVPTTEPHDSPGPPFREDDPGGSGFAEAVAWQLDQHGSIRVAPAAGGRLTVDLDSASSPNPGLAPTAALTA